MLHEEDVPLATLRNELYLLATSLEDPSAALFFFLIEAD